MDNRSFELIHKECKDALKRKALLQALHCIKGIIYDISSSELTKEYETIETNYTMMLRFMKNGGNDPSKEHVYTTLQRKTYTLLHHSARLFRLYHIKDTYSDSHAAVSDSLSSLMQQYQEIIHTLQSPNSWHVYDTQQERLEDISMKLFNAIWTSKLFTAEDASELSDFMTSISEHQQAHLISALTLSNMEYADEQKMLLLLRFCQCKSSYVRARALCGLVIGFLTHYDECAIFNELQEGTHLIFKEGNYQQELFTLQHYLLLSRESQKIRKTLQEKILPDLLKKQQQQKGETGTSHDKAPLSHSIEQELYQHASSKEMEKLEKSMESLVSLGKEGVDINLSTFSSLKRFAFFRSVSNWFLPFNPEYKEVKKVTANQQGKILLTMMEAGAFCDSDKYSLCLMMQQVMPMQKDLMMQQISSELEGHEEMMKESIKKDNDFKQACKFYLQDVYRFFKFFQYKHQFTDVFQTDLLFSHHTILSSYLEQPHFNEQILPYLLKYEYYEDAIDILTSDIQSHKASADIVLKCAICHKQIGQYKKALYYFQQAEMILGDRPDLLFHIAACYEALSMYNQQLKYLKKLSASQQETSPILFKMGHCLIQQNKFAEASDIYWELRYKNYQFISSTRALAWCLFKIQDYEDSIKLYEELTLSKESKHEDYLNWGHALWCYGNLKDAAEKYHQYASYKNDLPYVLRKDMNDLMENGITALDFHLMLDLLSL